MVARFFVVAFSLLSLAAGMLTYTGPGDRTGISALMIVRTQCLSTEYPGTGKIIWAYRDWDHVYAAPGSPDALLWQSLYGYAPEHTGCDHSKGGRYGWGEKMVSAGSYPPLLLSQSLTCGLPGSNGWCRGGLSQTLTADEPIPGHVVRYFEDAGGIVCDPSDASGVTCSRVITQQGARSDALWAVSSFGDTSLMKSYSWKLDSGLPVTSLEIFGTPGSNGWYRSTVSGLVSGIDGVSGVDASGYRYRINGGTWQSGTSFAITADGIYSVESESRDIAGNVGTRAETIRKDQTAPVVSLPFAPDGLNGWYRTLATISPAATDATSGVGAVSSPVTLAEGTQTITATSTDNAGNTGSVSRTYRADATLPSIALALSGTPGSNGWYRSTVSGLVSGIDGVSGVDASGYRYRINGGTWQSGTSFAITADGIYSVESESRDIAGNVGTRVETIRKDQAAPVVSVPTSPNGKNGWYITQPTIALVASDSTSGIESAVFDGYGRDTVTLASGIHPLIATARDFAGNTWAVSEVVKVDTQPPAFAPAMPAPGASGWHSASVTVAANATDSVSGLSLVEYRINGGPWQSGASVSVASDGNHVVEFRATDNAGNQAISLPQSFRLDAAPPISAFSNPPEGATVQASGAFTFSGASADALSGLASAEISLDGGRTWLPLVLDAGNWSYAWDTRQIPDGTYTILVRANDLAGNRENTARVQVIVGNAPPRIDMAEWWWLWDAGRLRVREGDIPIRDVTIQISCSPYHQDVTLRYTAETLPAEIRWDRRCGEGAYAAESGDYPVTATVCDTWGRCDAASGHIKVPLIAPPVPTSTPTALPTATALPSPTPHASEPPPTPTAAPVILERQEPPAPPRPPASIWLWSLAALPGLWLVFSLNSLSDPRPAALRRLGRSLFARGSNLKI